MGQRGACSRSGRLVEKNQLDPRSRVLVPGCGRGHDASAWAKAGFETTAMDLSDRALNDARESYESLPNLAFFPGDFLHEQPQDPYDLVFEHTLFCAIAPDSRETYASSLVRWLRPGVIFWRFISSFHFPNKVLPMERTGRKSSDASNRIFNCLRIGARDPSKNGKARKECFGGRKNHKVSSLNSL